MAIFINSIRALTSPLSPAVSRAVCVGAVAAVSAMLVSGLANLCFEVSMAITAIRAFAEAAVIVCTSELATLAICVIGLGLVARVISKWLSARIIGLGVIGLVICAIAQRSASSYPYGHDSRSGITRLKAALMSNGGTSLDLLAESHGTGTLFLSAPASMSGHAYIALNRLGRTTLSPQEIATKVEDDLGTVFPIHIQGGKHNMVGNGNLLFLGILPGAGHNPVRGYIVNDHCFKLVAQPGHTLEGTAYHGFVRDSNGITWMFQYGMNDSSAAEDPVKQIANYRIAEAMWSRMADDTKVAISFGSN